jgi:O-antigen/teichoic acid export membrane protein
LRRVPGEIALFGLFAIPPILVAHRVGISAAGYLAFALSLVTLAGSVFGPISLILLPVASELVTGGDLARIRRHVQRLVPAALAVGVGLTALVEVFADVGVRLYLGSDFRPAIGIVRAVALGIPGYVVFVSTRSVLDAVHHKAVSLRYAIIAFISFLIAELSISSGRVLATGLMLSTALSFLGLFTVVEVWRSLKLRVPGNYA